MVLSQLAKNHYRRFHPTSIRILELCFCCATIQLAFLDPVLQMLLY